MVKINASSVKIGGRSFNKDKSGYPYSPTVFSGVEIIWGAGACIEHPEASRATLSLWVPKTHQSYLPALGDVVEVDAAIQAGGDLSYGYPVRVFTGKVESVKLQDDKKATPAPVIPNSTNVTALTGWNFSYNTGSIGDPRVNINAQVGIVDGHSFTLPFQTGEVITNHWFFAKTPKIPVVAGKSYSLSWSGNYASSMSTETRFYNAAGAQIGATTSQFGISEKRVMVTAPALAVTMDFEVYAGMNQNYAPVAGLYQIGQFILGTDTSPGFRVNITAADALAEAARLRLSSVPWPFEPALNRQARIAGLASVAGVAFNGGLSEEQGYYEALGTSVRARDVDSYPALEAFQRTTMASGHTVLSANNIVQPSLTLDLPEVLLGDQPTSGIVYEWDGLGQGKSIQKTNGVVTRTNWASSGSATSATNFIAYAGTGGTAVLGLYGSSPKFGDTKVSATWNTSATGGTQGVSYKQTAITGASASKISAGMWVKPSVTRSFKLQVNLFMGATPAGTLTAAAATSATAGVWTYIKLDGVTATAAFDTVEVMAQAQSNMLSGQYIDVDGILIEKVAVGGGYFDRYTLDPSVDIKATERSNIPHFDASGIMDDVFEIDTSKVVNEIKVEMKRFIGTAGEPGWEQKDTSNEDFDQVFTDEAGSRKTTPQTRSIATDWAIRDAYLGDLLPSSVMVLKGQLLLAGQSKSQWRLSSSLKLVLPEVETQESMYNLLYELDRFGGLIKIDNAPALVAKYMRVRGGRIVLGDEAALEFDLEPVEYSAPIPLSRATLAADDTASNYRIRNFKTLTSNDLRTIGAR